VTYTITVTNSGQTAYNGATFTDPLTSVLANAVYKNALGNLPTILLGLSGHGMRDSGVVCAKDRRGGDG
jgi:hypothetical protein